MKRAIASLVPWLVFVHSAAAQVDQRWTDVNPNQSSLHATDPDGASGGRVNGLGRSADGSALYAATEMGGLYKSTDGGRTWTHLSGHVPMVTWDVEVDPSNANRVYATSWYDGKVNSLAGISVSRNGGITWSKPPSATPAAGSCESEDRRDNPSAFGIAIDPANTNRVFIGTNCGLAITENAGETWRFVDPHTGDLADTVWDVIVHQGVVDVCGDDGHRRSTDYGTTWTTVSDIPSGRCSIAASPDESYVILLVSGTTPRESDDGGATWSLITSLDTPPGNGRIPFVAVNDRAGSSFDLWFGDVRLYRASCTTPATPAPGGTSRCPSNGWGNTAFTRTAGAHDDTGDLIFAAGATADACPLLFSSDGGVYRNTLTASPACHSPAWTQPDVTPHALRVYSMVGVHRPGQASEDIYLGTQDAGSFATTNAGAAPPAWANRDCCDVHTVAAEVSRVLSPCCGGNIMVRLPGMVNDTPITNLPPGNLIGFKYPEAFVAYAPNSYAAVTTSGVFITTNKGDTPWTALGASTTPATLRSIRTSMSAGTPTFYVQSGDGNGLTVDRIYKFVGTGAGNWQQVNPPGGVGGFGIFAVDPVNPNRLFASHLQNFADPAMVLSTDGGQTWSAMPALDNLMTGGGAFRYKNTKGPGVYGAAAGPVFFGYPMPTLVAFDSVDSNVLIAGGADSGVFLSLDGGATWETITDPLNPGQSGNPHLPRPVFAYVDHEPGVTTANSLTIYIGTDGRGVWRFTRKPSAVADQSCAVSATKCVRPVDFQRMVLVCHVIPSLCRFAVEVPMACDPDSHCQRCEDMGFCPPWFQLFLEGLDLNLWDVAIRSRWDEPVSFTVVKTNTGAVVSFRPSNEGYRGWVTRNYFFQFTMKAAGRQGDYPLRIRLFPATAPYSAPPARAPRN